MTAIYVDADACPVKAEVERVGTRHGVKMFIVSNGGLRPSANPLVRRRLWVKMAWDASGVGA